jgi:hypothetical protein
VSRTPVEQRSWQPPSLQSFFVHDSRQNSLPPGGVYKHNPFSKHWLCSSQHTVDNGSEGLIRHGLYLASAVVPLGLKHTPAAGSSKTTQRHTKEIKMKRNISMKRKEYHLPTGACIARCYYVSCHTVVVLANASILVSMHCQVIIRPKVPALTPCPVLLRVAAGRHWSKH